MQCPRCHAENREGRRFCGECGLSFTSACPSCGFLNEGSEKFCGGCGRSLAAAPTPTEFTSPQSYTPKHLAEKILTSKSSLAGERKQVTVLFVDVSGFTSLSERLDPEEVHRLMSRAFDLMLAEVHRYEGTVNQFLGDGIMALFGAPIAHEDHARRAVHAALGIGRTLTEYQRELAPRGIGFRAPRGLVVRLAAPQVSALPLSGQSPLAPRRRGWQETLLAERAPAPSLRWERRRHNRPCHLSQSSPPTESAVRACPGLRTTSARSLATLAATASPHQGCLVRSRTWASMHLLQRERRGLEMKCCWD